MKPRTRTPRLLLLGAVAAFSMPSCSGSDLPPGVPLGVVTRVTVTPDTVWAGDEFEVEIEVENEGLSREVVRPCRERFGYRVRAANGGIAAAWPGGACHAELDTLLFDRHERWTGSIVSKAMLVAGDYRIEAGLVGLEDEFPWSSARIVVVQGPAKAMVFGTIIIDTCYTAPPDAENPMASLCGESTDFVALFDSTGAISTTDMTIGETRIRGRSVRGEVVRWDFTNPRFTTMWQPNGSVSVGMGRVESAGNDNIEMSVRANWLQGDGTFSVSAEGDYAAALDPDGIPLLDDEMHLVGKIWSYDLVRPDSVYAIGYVAGRVDLTVRNVVSAAATP